MQGIEDNWVIYEILLQHRNVLNAQIDLLIKQKKKIYESRF
jgi:ParB family chromosome partitioning protein